MKLIIAGSRDLVLEGGMGGLYEWMRSFGLSHPSEIVSGMSGNIDNLAAAWAKHADVNLVEFHANWEKQGKAAGPIRNRKMAEYGDVLLLLWNGKSKGSASMKAEMEKLGKPIHEVIL